MSCHGRELSEQLHAHNGMEINTCKTTQMVLGRLANTASQTVQRVTTYKLLGVHIEHIIKNATTKLYFLKQLKKIVCPIVTYFIFMSQL